MSVYEHTTAEIWNSEMMRRVRRQMAAGEPVPECRYCYSQAKANLPNMWSDVTTAWERGWLNPRNETAENLKSRARATNFVLAGPESLMLRVGNLCNLKCRMCEGVSSSAILADPVHSRWRKEVPSVLPPRWKGRETTIAPVRVLGVAYFGLGKVDWQDETPVAWTDGAARVVFNRAPSDITAVSITLGAERPVNHQIRIEANAEVLYDGVPPEGEWTRAFELSKEIMDSAKLEISIISPVFRRKDNPDNVGVGIKELKLLRSEKQRNNISLSRFDQGDQWSQNREFLLKDLFYDPQALRKITFLGGEPFLIAEVKEIARYLVDTGVAKNIDLVIMTNGTVKDDEWLELASRFGRISLMISLDGFEKVNEYIRYPSDWSVIRENIKWFQSLPNSYVFVHATIQAYNMLNIGELIDFCEEVDLDFHYALLEEPDHLSGLSMPTAVRKAAAARLRRLAMRNEPDRLREKRHFDHREAARSLADAFENAVDRDVDAHVREFMIYTNDLDASRNQTFASVGSEIIGLLEECGYPWIKETRYAKYGLAATARLSTAAE